MSENRTKAQQVARIQSEAQVPRGAEERLHTEVRPSPACLSNCEGFAATGSGVNQGTASACTLSFQLSES